MPAYNVMTVREAALRLGISSVRVRQLCGEGRLGKRLGGRWIIQESELEQFRKLPRLPGRPVLNR